LSNTTSLRRVVLFICGVAVGLFVLTGVASAEPQKHSKDNSSPQPASKADYSGKGANQHGSYDSTRDGSPSGNGNGGGKAKGKPCAGCVGKADNKNPKGQAPDGRDRNAGYECDRNRGIGRTNPAHTGCRMTSGSTVGSGTSGSGTSGETGSQIGSGDTDSTIKPVGDTDVAGVVVERAASPAGTAGAGVSGSDAIRGRAADAAVAGAVSAMAGDQGGLATLPLTGAGAGVVTLAFLAVALLGVGALLSRVRRVQPVVA